MKKKRSKKEKKNITSKKVVEISFKQFFDLAIEKMLVPAYTSSRALELHFTSCGFGPKETYEKFLTGLGGW